MASSISPEQGRRRPRPANARKASAERLAAMAAANKPSVENVRVVAATPALQRALVHPSGRKLRPSGATEWPMDPFTVRRLKEGSIRIEEPKNEEHADKAPHRPSARHA